MKLPEKLDIRVFHNGRPQAGMFVKVKVETDFKNDFLLAFGPTGGDGRLNVLRDDILSEADKEKRAAMMDFGCPELNATGMILVSAMNRDALKRAIKAYDLYYASGMYPPRYAENIQEAMILLDELGEGELQTEADGSSSEFDIYSEAVHA